MGDLNYLENWNVQLKKSALPYAILLLLSKKKCYGYLIISIIQDCMGFIVTDGTIYPLLARFEKIGYVASEWELQEFGVPRKYYSLTTAGRDCLYKIKASWEDIQIGLSNIIEE